MFSSEYESVHGRPRIELQCLLAVLQVYPIMGAGYHTIHHTSYKHNYGHYTIFMDQLYGTMLTPEEEEEERVGAKHRALSPAGSVCGGSDQDLGPVELAKAGKAH